MSSPILISREGRVLTITFNRPGSLNAIDLEMSRGLEELTDTLKSETAASVVVLRGAGRAFSAGGDVFAFRGTPSDVTARVEEILTRVHGFIRVIDEIPQVVIASAHGVVAGGAIGIMLACDFVIISSETKFAPGFRQLGISPDSGVTYSLPRAIGRRHALEILLLSDSFDASEALSLGLVNHTVPGCSLEKATTEFARKFASIPADLMARTKGLVRASLDQSLTDQLSAEERSFVVGAQGDDFREGVSAFLEKRKPTFPSLREFEDTKGS